MTVLNLHNICKYYGDKPVLEGVFLQICQNEKVGLVGPNGAGKTTLLRTITGEEEPDQGSYTFARAVSVGYLKQTPEIVSGATLYEQLKDSLKHIYFLREQIKDMEKEMASEEVKKNPGQLTNIMEKYGRISHLFEEKGGYVLDNRIRQVALGLGFNREDLNRPVESFSGGEKTRMQLACLLLEEHDLLLLDEPTNYLDTEAVEWLEEFLKAWKGTLLVVSHDRYFLDRVANRIAALEDHRLKIYNGNYSSYIKQYLTEKLSMERACKKQEDVIKKEEEFIRTSGGGERDKRQAGSREKRLEKLERLKKPQRNKTMSLTFNFAGRAGQEVVVFKQVSKFFETVELFKDVSFKIKWGDKVALAGPNGAGKTTLLKMITGLEKASKGNIKIGPSVKIAYFAQEQSQLNPLKTPLEEITDLYSLTLTEARNYLGRYLFKGDEVFKLNRNLSGGEKSRLVMAKIALSQANFLILDEPTNHLDINGITELESALSRYPGTLLVVSHDRYFIDRTAAKILEICQGQVKLFDCGYQEYREIKEREEEKGKVFETNVEKDSRKELREQGKARREAVLAQRREKRNLEMRLQETEDRISSIEKEIAFLENKLADPDIYDDFEEVRKITEKYNKAKVELEMLYRDWERTSLKFEEMKTVN
ncbi:MAG: thiamine ABC transporter substrate-binding protein [Firmicutes bacterium HGW-Firmicutes-13]|nr:MAG: thiamine ABC transporter substrate-binding protein [Firmicutes bacterium HGW-Firmicutes-13]